jgi:CAAX prenyl protease-like protein
VYLLPLLTILAAGAISHALSGKFETFYPLRLMASIMVLWLLRRHLRAMAWQWRWPALAVGFGLFALWWVAAHLLLPAAPVPEALAAMPPWGRWVWVASRVLGAVATVPLAEELAYRGYLMRRLQGEDFERTSYAAVRGFALGLSSVLFGVMHGPMWLPGTLAGLAYGLLAKRSGGLGESVLAHAVTNALLAACVLGLADWRLW